MVCLHTATMGVHPACFFTDRVEKDATLAWNRAGKQSSYLVHSSLYCAPTGERQGIFADRRPRSSRLPTSSPVVARLLMPRVRRVRGGTRRRRPRSPPRTLVPAP